MEAGDGRLVPMHRDLAGDAPPTLEQRLHDAVARLEQATRDLDTRFGRLESELKARIDAFEDAISAGERLTGSELPARLIELAGLLSTLAEAGERLRGDVADLRRAGEEQARRTDQAVHELDAAIGRQRAETDVGRRQLVRAAAATEARLLGAITAANDAFVADATDAATAARGAATQLLWALERFGELGTALGQFGEELQSHRDHLDAGLAATRSALLEDTIALVLDRLSKRDRRRLAERLLATLESDRPAPRPAPPALIPPVPRPDPAPRPPATFLPAEGDIEELADSGTLREELLAWVTTVPGVGAVRAAALADAFGSLDRLVAADADEIAAATGLPDRVATAVLAQVRGGRHG